MLQKLFLIITLSLCMISLIVAAPAVSIIKLSGEVRVRYGVEEEWNLATASMSLRDIDTILTGENGEVILKLEDGSTFTMSQNAVLDIADLRTVQEKDLFVFLMSQKIRKIEPRNGKTKLRVGSVSVVHGAAQANTDSAQKDSSQSNWSDQETNGALSLFKQEYYPNTIIKLHKILDKYSSLKSKGRLFFYIAKSFEALEMTGQAKDSYQIVIDFYQEQDSLSTEDKKFFDDAKVAKERLKS